MATILDWNFDNEFSSKAYKIYRENDPLVNNRKPHIGESLFGKEDTTEEKVVFVDENVQVSRLGSLGAPDMPTPFRGYVGTKVKNLDFPYFVEGWHDNQEEAMKLARLIENSTGRPSDAYIDRQILNIYKRTDDIVNGMLEVREFMIMNLLTKYQFTIENADEFGPKLSDVYNYDPAGTFASTHTVTLGSTDAWVDTTNSDPIKDLMDVDKKLRLSGARLEAMIMNTKTFGYFIANAKIKNYAPLIGGLQPNYIYSIQDIERIIAIRLNHEIKILVDDEVYKGWNDAQANFYPDNQVTFLGSMKLGTMWCGLTYEEAFNRIHGGNAYDKQARLAEGILVSEYMKNDPDEKVFRISQSCVPSFEGMNLVYNYKWEEPTP